MEIYFEEINQIIETTEVNKRTRILIDNSETLNNYWHIGKLLIEAQGGETRAKYGNGLIKEWSKIFVDKYGKGYNYANLTRMRKFYMVFQKVAPPGQQLNWSHIRAILPIKEESKRNYYINQVIINNLSKNDLIKLIKSNAYERLSYKDKINIQLIEDNNYTLTIEDMIKNPILIKVGKEIDKLDELALHKYLIEMVSNKFLELGTGFALAGHEYKININNRVYKIDLLFFNVKLNSCVVVELKTKEIQHKDISRLQFYVNYVDRNIKKINHNKTIGILIVRKNNTFVIKYTTSNDK